MSEIREEAIVARTAEGDTGGPDGWSRAFALWNGVHEKIEAFRKGFYLNPNVEWARTKTVEFTAQRRWEGFWIGVASGIAASAVLAALAWLVTR